MANTKKKRMSYLKRLFLTYKIRLKRYFETNQASEHTSAKKKYKLSNNAILLGISFILIIVIVLVLKVTMSNYRISTQTKLGYTKDEAQYILDNNLKDITKEYGYSEFFIESHKNGTFDNQYIDLYFYLDHFTDRTIYYYNHLLARGYNEEEVQKILTSLNDNLIMPLLVYDKQTKLDQYINDAKKGKLSKDYIHIYENATIVDKVELGTIINKKNGLASTYEPDNLKSISNYCAFNPSKMQEEAADAFTQMCMDAKDAGIYFASMIAYRSYSEQDSIYSKTLDQVGSLQVDVYTSKAGFNEHQTGLAVNVGSMASYPEGTTFAETNEYAWLQANAASYGFIFRYPEGSEYLTGYATENDHLRYVGVDLAAKISKANMVMEEYYALNN